MKPNSSRSALPIHIKKEICDLEHLQPNLTYNEIAKIINEKYLFKIE